MTASKFLKVDAFLFMAGASGVMTGNYLTTGGRSLEEDVRLIRDLGLETG